jgi:DNA polymerase-3 subunit gamma/tau
MHLSSIKINKKSDFNINKSSSDKKIIQKKNDTPTTIQAVSQIKNIAQEIKDKPEIKSEVEANNKDLINSFNDLLEVCAKKKEIKLKFELEKNVNLVKFEKNRIEISFNDNLDKNFVKNLSTKLFEWTDERWIITFSKSKGEMSVREKQNNKKEELINDVKKSEIYKNVIQNFPDAELVDVKLNKKED